ncbi:hypothetical protein EBU99_02525 [bacterium]|nr:hypothetical protein [bacterium]
MKIAQLVPLNIVMLTLAAIAGCRRVDSAESSAMATKPSELFSTDAKKRCNERANQLPLNSAQQSSLCDGASSSAPVDCFKRKTAQGASPDSAVAQCRGVR